MMRQIKSWQIKMVLFSLLFSILFSFPNPVQAKIHQNDTLILGVGMIMPVVTCSFLGSAVGIALGCSGILPMVIGAALGVGIWGYLNRDNFQNNTTFKPEQSLITNSGNDRKAHTVVNPQNTDIEELEARYKTAYSEYQNALNAGDQENIADLAEKLRQAKEAYFKTELR